MSTFKFIDDNNNTLDFSTKSIVVEKLVPMKVNVSLWESIGKHISYEQLANLGYKIQYIPTQSKARMEYEKITFIYEKLPEFVTAVTTLKAMYDQIGVSYNCTAADIEVGLNDKIQPSAQVTWYAKFNTTLDKGVALNYQEGSRLYYESVSSEDLPEGMEETYVDDFVVWTDFPKLVKWLPGTFEESEIPVRRVEEVIETQERQDEIMAEETANE